ncbi:MAG: squalene--hopene cyclase [Thermoguttaceae bacterium]|jgi:outer membrane biosynthesis protein TonB
MGAFVARLWSRLTSMDLVMGLLWLGLFAFTVSLVVLIWTRWGLYRPLRKCLLLSLVAHLLLAGYATTVRIVTGVPLSDPPPLRISYIEGPVGPGGGPVHAALREAAATQPADTPVDPPDEPRDTADAHAAPMPEPPRPDPPKPPDPAPPQTPPAKSPALVDVPKGDAPQPSPESAVPGTEPPPAVAARETLRPAPSQPVEPTGAAKTDATAAISSQPAPPPALPEVYKLRVAPDRLGVAEGGGGTPETEAAVGMALRWLADNQSSDGRWDANAHEAGRETLTNGQNRRQAGIQADSAMTGLALLAFLAAGHTHERGPYRENIRQGLEYLLLTQAGDGNLAGRADSFAMMYSHAMAAFALSEAYGMTHDQRLRDATVRAIGYTIAAQDPVGGGWRYRPGDPGDTSQLGWQFMALKSAELAGIPIPEHTRQGIVRYLQSVASGQYGGLASYQPGKAVTRTMTAEALACWQFLGLGRDHPACSEAAELLLKEPPSQWNVNIYYWYYATLAIHQLQGAAWDRWNEALRTQLVASQRRTAGSLAGTWDPDAVWGGYGGRVFSTALSTLCLEVYYRYLPLYGRPPEATSPK